MLKRNDSVLNVLGDVRVNMFHYDAAFDQLKRSHLCTKRYTLPHPRRTSVLVYQMLHTTTSQENAIEILSTSFSVAVYFTSLETY